MPGMPLGGLGNSCRRPFLLDAVQWCACAFPNSLSTYENGLNTSPLREAVRQLVAFGFSQQFALE